MNCGISVSMLRSSEQCLSFLRQTTEDMIRQLRSFGLCFSLAGCLSVHVRTEGIDHTEL